jgi:hypothetical protein
MHRATAEGRRIHKPDFTEGIEIDGKIPLTRARGRPEQFSSTRERRAQKKQQKTAGSPYTKLPSGSVLPTAAPTRSWLSSVAPLCRAGDAFRSPQMNETDQGILIDSCGSPDFAMSLLTYSRDGTIEIARARITIHDDDLAPATQSQFRVPSRGNPPHWLFKYILSQDGARTEERTVCLQRRDCRASRISCHAY